MMAAGTIQRFTVETVHAVKCQHEGAVYVHQDVSLKDSERLFSFTDPVDAHVLLKTGDTIDIETYESGQMTLEAVNGVPIRTDPRVEG
jgi:hypothetical protein